MAWGSWVNTAGDLGSVFGKTLGSGISAQAFGGNFASGIRYGLLGALKSEAYGYMAGETDKLASAWWGKQGGPNYDEFGRIWAYGNRGCASGDGSFCTTAFPNSMLMPPEYSSNPAITDSWHTVLPVLGTRLGETPLFGAALNSVSKVHDWLNNALTSVYYTDATSANYGAAKDFGRAWNTAIDVISTAGMLPAAVFTSGAIYSNPLTVKRR